MRPPYYLYRIVRRDRPLTTEVIAFKGPDKFTVDFFVSNS